MEIVIIGSGTCVPSLRRAGPSILIRVHDTTILVDSASGTLRQLIRAGIHYHEIDLILYTHFHLDHVGELAPYLFVTKYAPGFKRARPVRIMASEGLLALYEGLRSAFGHWVEPEKDMVSFEEIPHSMESAIQLPPITIRALPLSHTPQSLAYRIEDKTGKSVVISGDTDFSKELSAFSRGTDLLVLECARPEGQKVPGHLTPSEAGIIAQQAGTKVLLLTHFYPDCDQSDMLTPLKRHYSGPVILAEDLMRIPII